MKDKGIRLVPEMAAVFHLTKDGAYSSNQWPFWMRWGWCKVSDVLQLINREHGFKWKKRDLLTRFALDSEEIRDSAYLKQKPPMGILMPGDKGPFTFQKYSRSLLPQLEKAEQEFYVPAGWVKDVLWALYGGCTRYRVEDEKPGENQKHKKAVVACFESGEGVYYV